jgi:hypothetical protein
MRETLRWIGNLLLANIVMVMTAISNERIDPS